MTLAVELLECEYWWGGSSNLGAAFPLGRDSHFEMKPDYTGNQTMPFFVSTSGRYVYSTRPMGIAVAGGKAKFTSDGEITALQSGDCLRDAYLGGMRKHFPFTGERVHRDFFTRVQYNTWIECHYDPTAEAVLRYAHEIIDHGFEPGILMIDEGWHRRYGDWDFDRSKFPDPKATVDELHSLGFTVMLWTVPFVTADGELFRDLCWSPDPPFQRRVGDGRVAIVGWWNGYSAVLDFSHERDRIFLGDQLERLMRDYGIDGFKFDGGNAEIYAARNYMNGEPDTDCDMYGLSLEYNKFAARYPFHEVKDSYGTGGMPLVGRLVDKNHVWGEGGLSELIPDAALAGLIGSPFICPDMVGGGNDTDILSKPIDGELFVRWAQCSALFPMMQYSKKPWSCLSPEHCRMVTEAGRLHGSLSGYIAECVSDAESSGEPILRLLEYSYPHMGYEGIVDEFLLGEDILSAPVLTPGAREREVVLPPGVWLDSDGREYAGGRVHRVAAPLDKLPWFRRK